MLVAFLILQGFGQDIKQPSPPPPKPYPLPTKIIPKSVSDENSSKPKVKSRPRLPNWILKRNSYKSLDWSDFTYNSPEEKVFWDDLLELKSDVQVENFNPFNPTKFTYKINARGQAIGSNSSEGFNGYIKKKGGNIRTVYKFVDGHAVRGKSWFQSGQKAKEVTYKGEKANGLHAKWYENGQKENELNYKDGFLDGLQTNWYENGQKKWEGNYKDGYFYGLYTTWYENGQKKEEGTCKVSNSSRFISNSPGFLFFRGSPSTYTEGLRYQANWDGLYAVWYENGQKKEESTHKGGKILSLARWGENGEKCPETNLNDGNGIVVNYHENGQKDYEYNYKDGKKDGLQTAWDKNGQKKSETNYKDGKKAGLSTEWYENGQISDEENYKDGLLSYAKVWLPDGKECPESKVIDGNGTLVTYSLDGKEISRKNIRAGRTVFPLGKSRTVTIPPRKSRTITLSGGRTLTIPPRNPRPILKRLASSEANSSKSLPPPPPKILPPAPVPK